MGALMDILSPNRSKDIIIVNCIERISYGDWIRQRQVEYMETQVQLQGGQIRQSVSG